MWKNIFQKNSFILTATINNERKNIMSDYYFRGYITNLGKYNEGELVGKWITFPITKKELDIRGGRTSAGEFEEALEIINEDKIPVKALLTKCISVSEAPKTVIDIEKNPGNYMKVVVTF